MSSLCLLVLNSFWELFELYHNIWCWKFSFSVHQCQIKSKRQSSGWSRKDSLIALPGKGRHSGMYHALKTTCPNMGKIVWSFIVIIERGCDQPMDILPMGGWWGEKLISSSFRSNWSGVYMLTEKAMAPHSSTLAWKIPQTEEPGRLQSMRSLRVGHDWATSLSLFTFTHWRRKWQPTPVFLPGESQGQRSLVGCCLWGHTELDTTEVT